jgi:hypothetical protein
MTLRIDLSTVFGVPPEELVDQELAAEFRDVVEQMSEDPVLRAEWVEFWLAFSAGFHQQSYED